MTATNVPHFSINLQNGLIVGTDVDADFVSHGRPESVSVKIKEDLQIGRLMECLYEKDVL